MWLTIRFGLAVNGHAANTIASSCGGQNLHGIVGVFLQAMEHGVGGGSLLVVAFGLICNRRSLLGIA